MFEIMKNLSVDSLDTVPEDFRFLYGEGADGKFVVTEAAKKTAVAIGGLGSALVQARGEAAAAKKKAVDLTDFSDYGATVEEIKEGIAAKIKELTEAVAAKGGDAAKHQKALEQQKLALTEAHDKAGALKDAKVEGLTGQLHKHLVGNQATLAITAAKGDPELLLPFLSQHVRVEDVDGNLVPQVYYPESGEPRFGATGSPMTIAELVADMKGQEKYGKLFESESADGGGKPPGGHTPPGGRKQSGNQEDMSPRDKIVSGLAKRRR